MLVEYLAYHRMYVTYTHPIILLSLSLTHSISYRSFNFVRITWMHNKSIIQAINPSMKLGAFHAVLSKCNLCEDCRLVPPPCGLCIWTLVSTEICRTCVLVVKTLTPWQRFYCGLYGCLSIRNISSYAMATALSILWFKVICWRIRRSSNCIRKVIRNEYFKHVCMSKFQKITHNYDFYSSKSQWLRWWTPSLNFKV